VVALHRSYCATRKGLASIAGEVRSFAEVLEARHSSSGAGARDNPDGTEAGSLPAASFAGAKETDRLVRDAHLAMSTMARALRS
jgi:hypothetical protein